MSADDMFDFLLLPIVSYVLALLSSLGYDTLQRDVRVSDRRRTRPK